ncbi:MAG: haloacid dehalogenase-like hydrolase, partial [Pseudomonadota bacterium]
MARGSAKAPRKSSRAGKTLAKSARAEAPSEASFDKAVIALVYDFDGTLSPRPMQEYAFLPKIGVDPRTFWEESNRIAAEEGADPLITYMHLLYKKAKDAGVRVDREDLVAQGREVELFAGVEA